jgi:hypothetical protein
MGAAKTLIHSSRDRDRFRFQVFLTAAQPLTQTFERSWRSQETGLHSLVVFLPRVMPASAVAEEKVRPKPRLPLFNSGQPGLARRSDEALDGFGEG